MQSEMVSILHLLVPKDNTGNQLKDGEVADDAHPNSMILCRRY